MPEKGFRKKSEQFYGLLMIAPTIIGLLVLNIIPIFMTIRETFYKTGDFGKGLIFYGFKNYEKVFADERVWQALINTIKYAIIEVPVSVVISLVIAVLLNRKMKGRSIYRTIFFMPMIVAPAAIAMVWRWIFNSDFGLLNNTFNLSINWMSSPDIAIYSIAIIGIWSVIGYNMVLFLAGLQEIPRDYYEASKIDGANGVKQFFKITLPLLSPMIFFVLVTRTLGALQVFDLIYMTMDRSNPALYKTQSLVYLFYKTSFIENNRGIGSTIVILLLLLIMAVTAFQFYAQKKWVHYE